MASLLKRIESIGRRRSTGLLSIGQILAWADAHHAATGRWPVRSSGQVRHATSDWTWVRINKALRKGLEGTPSQTLATLLHERRGVKPGTLSERERSLAENACPRAVDRSGYRKKLSVARIVAWADDYHAATGRWPTSRSGSIPGVTGDNWRTVAEAVRNGRRGLPGGVTLTALLTERRGRVAQNLAPNLRVEQILRWADAHRRAHGCWPNEKCGQVDGVPGETWKGIAERLRKGGRGLDGGVSLSRLLADRRGARNSSSLPDLTIRQILAWADAHHLATGNWPHEGSGSVRGVPGEDWKAINEALKSGRRGLAGGSSLVCLRDQHRPQTKRDLTLEIVMAWANAHLAATGRWPTAKSGAIRGARGEKWSNVDRALRLGLRGFSGGLSLARILDRPIEEPMSDLTLDQVLTWAKAYHAATGNWPNQRSGAITGAPVETWRKVDEALRLGERGLPMGFSLSHLFGYWHRSLLTLDQILAWGNAHRLATGRWPTRRSGPIPGLAAENWQKIDANLRDGHRGLPAGLSVKKLFAQRRLPGRKRYRSKNKPKPRRRLATDVQWPKP